MMLAWIILLMILLTATPAYVYLRRRGLQRWLLRYLAETPRRRRPRDHEEVHVILCITDHYEPKWQRPTPEIARARVETWLREYPRQLGHFRDSDGRPPQYTFFYPFDEYEPEYLELLAELCRDGYGEVEVHLHHDRDTSAALRDKLLTFKEILVDRHGLLSRHRDTGQVGYAFIHGNWALCNSKSGKYCGVNNELTVLRETGCYADFTFPSAPDPGQPPIINRIYYASDVGGGAASHYRGVPIGEGTPPQDALLLVSGPLLLDWQDRKWGVVPHIENSCLQASQPPSIARLDNWLKARVQVPGRPDWFFVKLHAHGAPEESRHALLGEPMVRFHEELKNRSQRNANFHYHYVTAREMYNLVKAAEAGWRGTVAEARDYLLVSNLQSQACVATG